jgi:N-sulfoglucosamine sulfohydrolase
MMKHTLLTALLLAPLAALHAADATKPAPKPNILWLVAEDMGVELGCYGTPEVRTPHLDRLASDGVRYTRFYATAPICSPSRSAFQTGMYATSIGAHPQRVAVEDLQPLPPGVRLISEWMHDTGYFTANLTKLPPEVGFKGSGKTDWNFQSPAKPFDSGDWRDLKPNQPFFAQLHFHHTHRPFTSPRHADPEKVTLPPYYPDHPVVRADWAAYLDAVSDLDGKIGEVLEFLEDAGLAQSTIVIFFADHGHAHVRGKGYVYEEGLHAPLIIRWPKALHPPADFRSSTVDDRLLEAIDLTATTLSLAGLPKPREMQGRIFLGPHREAPRDYVFGARDRFDESVLHLRSVRDERFRYIRNFMPEKPLMSPHLYKELSYPAWNLIKDLAQKGELPPAQAALAAPHAPAEELYDLETDPHEIHNLAATPDHRATLEKLRAALDRWMEETGDQGRTPESPAIVAKWGGYMREFWDSVDASRQGKGKVSVPWLRNRPASAPQTPKPSK